jgi:hypothetical protein
MIDSNKLNIALESIKAKLATLEPSKVAELEAQHKSLEPQEIVLYQELKSIAQISNKISLDVALWIYNTINHYCTANLADKVLLTQIIAAFLGQR